MIKGFFGAHRFAVFSLFLSFFFQPWALSAVSPQEFSKKTPENAEVVIIGAGLSGMATAYELKKRGIEYHILEISPTVGGRVRTAHYKIDGEDLYADFGMEEYWESNPAVELLKELKLPLNVDVAASSMVLDGKLYPYTEDSSADYLKKVLGDAGYLALEGFKSKVGALLEKLQKSKTIPKDMLALKEKSFADWVLSLKLPKKVSEWVRVSVECEAGTEWNRIAALDGLAEFHIFLGTGEKSYRVLGGNEKFVQTLAEKVGTSNFSVNKRVNRIVADVNKKSSKFPVSVYYIDNQTHESSVIQAGHVVNTIPLFRLFEVQFDPVLSNTKRQAIQSQSWGSYFKAHVFVPSSAQKLWTKNDASILPLLSDSDLGVIYDGNPDQNTKTKILSLLVTGMPAERFNLMPLDEVRKTITAKLDALWPGLGKEIKGIEFYRYHPRAIAAWAPGRSRFDALSDEVRKPQNHIYFAGDFTETSHSDGAFLSAKRVTEQIVAAKNGAVK